MHDEIFESEVVLKKPAFVIGQDSYTPSAMDMCTPFRPQQCVILQFWSVAFCNGDNFCTAFAEALPHFYTTGIISLPQAWFTT